MLPGSDSGYPVTTRGNLMVYLAILLVLTGLFIILMVLFSESGKHGVVERSIEETPYSGPVLSDMQEPEDIDILLPEEKLVKRPPAEDEDVFTTPDIDINAPEKSIHEQLEDWDYPGDDYGGSVSPGETVGYVPGGSDASTVDAVLFDDKSNAVDYNSGGSFTGISLEGCKNIRRTGRGKLHLDDDGLSFYLDGKLYRFDFHRIYDLWNGANFIALPLKGSSTVKLFIVEGSEGFPERVAVYFQEYMKGA